MSDKIVLTTREERYALLKDGEVRSYSIYIHHPGGLWTYNWGQVFCDSAPSYDMFRDFLEEDDIEEHFKSLEHDCGDDPQPSPSEFVHALTFPECIQFLPVPLNRFEGLEASS